MCWSVENLNTIVSLIRERYQIFFSEEKIQHVVDHILVIKSDWKTVRTGVPLLIYFFRTGNTFFFLEVTKFIYFGNIKTLSLLLLYMVRYTHKFSDLP